MIRAELLFLIRCLSLRRALVLILLVGLPLGFGQAGASFWRDAIRLRLLGVERLADNDIAEAVPLLEAAARLEPRSALGVAWLAHAFHLARRLDEAGVYYRRLLERDPPADVDAARRHAMLRHAPRVFQVASDPFPLLDAAAVHHPEEPLIAYHFFWQDDIDLPDDHDPCDHELVWVRYDPATEAVVGFWSYFQGRILSSDEAVRAANAAGGRARVNVQWGKHGSLPEGWEKLSIQANTGDIERPYLDLSRPRTLLEYNRATFDKLSREGRARAEHPRTSAWPVRFAGSWEDFVRFDREVPFASRLEERSAMAVSRWNNAVIEQKLVPYNFRPRTEWPDRSGAARGAEAQLDRRVGASGEGLLTPSEAMTLRAAASVDPDPFLTRVAARPAGLPVELPSMAPFRPETPRYPNLWFYAPAEHFARYDIFVGELRNRLIALGYETSEVSLNEGADFAVSIEHLEPWGDVPGLAHAHSLHLRLFWKRLERVGGHRVPASRGEFWRVAASVHYEVEHASQLHADVRSCPLCGRTGGYARAPGHLVEMVHDPLGLELALTGRVRGREVRLLGKGPLTGLIAAWKVGASDVALSRPFRQDVNTGAVAVVFLR